MIRYQMLVNVTDAIHFKHTSLHTVATQSLIQRNHTLNFGKAVRHL